MDAALGCQVGEGADDVAEAGDVVGDTTAPPRVTLLAAVTMVVKRITRP